MMNEQDNHKDDNPKESIADLEVTSAQAEETKAGSGTSGSAISPGPVTWTYKVRNPG